MSFLDHLEELRWHLVRSVVAILLVTIIAFIAKDFVFGIISGPARVDFTTYQFLCRLVSKYGLAESLCINDIGFELMNMSMAGQFTQHITISFVVGFVVAFPYVFWEFWRFVSPALSKKERKSARGIVFFSTLLFALGVLTGYYVLAPVSIQFLGGYELAEAIENSITLKSYISTLVMIVLACALVFELPMAVFFLSKAGLITPSLMKNYRRHAFVVVLILSAIITPPDVLSQILLTIPFFLLYELSIGISARILKKRKD
ncbi:MAG: twin-arginine translocase subunit TatC [Bacteroidetes bacterium]|nr:twin-arginine translocase subunit TatC [Bacteroidota bacterium]